MNFLTLLHTFNGINYMPYGDEKLLFWVAGAKKEMLARLKAAELWIKEFRDDKTTG